MGYPCQQEHTQAADDVAAERARQDAKWGEQNHAPSGWIVILAEELGEAAREAAAVKFGSEHHGGAADPLARFRAEMIQCAAVALAAVECVDRNRPGDRKT